MKFKEIAKDENLETMLDNLMGYCREKGYPMIASILTNPKNDEYRTVMVSPGVLQAFPSGRDMITDCLKVFNGYVPVLSSAKDTSNNSDEDFIETIQADEKDESYNEIKALLNS